MKKNFYTLFLLACGIIALNSCKSSKESMAQRKADIELSKEPTPGCFVQMNDGTIKNYSSLILVKKMLTAPYLLADGNIKISAGEITAYQN